MAKLTPLLKALLVPGCDVVVCGTDKMAEGVRESLQELGLDLHVIADSKLSPSRIWCTTLVGLREFAGGGRN